MTPTRGLASDPFKATGRLTRKDTGAGLANMGITILWVPPSGIIKYVYVTTDANGYYTDSNEYLTEVGFWNVYAHFDGYGNFEGCGEEAAQVAYEMPYQARIYDPRPIYAVEYQ